MIAHLRHLPVGSISFEIIPLQGGGSEGKYVHSARLIQSVDINVLALVPGIQQL